MNDPAVQIILGSKSDQDPYAIDCINLLFDLKIFCRDIVISAHRNPNELKRLVTNSPAKVFIGMAGMSAHLPGVIASMTDRPVIGVPLPGPLGGQDSLYSISQMPTGVPVACMAVGGAKNAALFAAKILALTDTNIQKQINDWKQSKGYEIIGEQDG